MASSQSDPGPISPAVDYLSVVLSLRGPTTLPQIFNYIKISPYSAEVGTSVDQVEHFLSSNPLHFRVTENQINILGFGDTDEYSNRSICIKMVYPTSVYKINNIQNDSLITTDGVSYCTDQQLPTVNRALEVEDIRVISNLKKKPISFINEVKRTSCTEVSASSNLTRHSMGPSELVATNLSITAVDSFDVLEGVNTLKKALLEHGPLPVRRLVGYLANARKPVRNAVGKNKDELLRFLLADDRFVVSGEDNLVCIKTVIINGSSAERNESSVRLHDTNISSLSTSVKLSRSEMTKQIAGMNDLSRAHLTRQELDRIEGIRVLTKALTRNGPMPLSSLLGNLSQTTREVRDAIGGSITGTSHLDFLRTDRHFIVQERDGQCIVYLNPDVINNQGPHSYDFVIEGKSIGDLPNIVSSHCDGRSVICKSIREEPDIGYCTSRIMPSYSSIPRELELKRPIFDDNKQIKTLSMDQVPVKDRFKIQITQMATITMLSKNGNTGFALFDNGEKVFIGVRFLQPDSKKTLTNLNNMFSVEDRVCIRACIGESSGSCKWQALRITRKMENVNNSVQTINHGNLRTSIQSKSQTIQQSGSLHYFDRRSETNINSIDPIEEPDIVYFNSGNSSSSSRADHVGLDFEQSFLEKTTQTKMITIDKESIEDRYEIQIAQMATITLLAKNGRSGFALFDNGENIFIGVDILKLDGRTITNLNDRFSVNDRVFISACIGASSASCKWKAVEISRKFENVNNSVKAVNLSNSEAGIQVKSLLSLTFENSRFASKTLTVESPSIASSVSSSIENGSQFLETKSFEQECPESQGMNILKEVLSERGPLPAENLFGYFSKTSKFVREAVGKNPKELLQYLMNSDHFIVRGSNNLVYIKTDRANCSWDRESSCEEQAVVEEVQTRSISTLTNSTQLSAMKLEDEIESGNPNLKQLHTAELNSDLTTTSSQAGVDFLKKVLSDTEYMPLKTLEFIILNCCEPICDSFGENACMLLEFLQHDNQFVVEGDDQIVRMRTRSSDVSLICSSDDRSLSDNVTEQELQASCSSSNVSETVPLDLNSIKLIALTHIITWITLFGPASVDQLELISIEDELLGRSTLPQVLALRNGGGADPVLQGKCLVRDFISRQKDVLCIFDDIVYLIGSPEYAKTFIESISTVNLEDQKENVCASSPFAEASVQYPREKESVPEPEIYLSSNGNYLTMLPDVEHTTVKTLALQFVLTVLEVHRTVSINVLQTYEHLASREVKQLFGKNSEQGNFTKECVKKFCRDFSEVLRYNKRTKTISLIDTTWTKENTKQTDDFDKSDSQHANSFVKEDTAHSDDARPLSNNKSSSEVPGVSSSNVRETISPDLTEIKSTVPRKNETAIKKSVENVSCHSTESSVQLLKEVVSAKEAVIDVTLRDDVLPIVTDDKLMEISVDSLALQFIVNVIQMHGPVSLKVLRKFEHWASREVCELLGKCNEESSFSKNRVRKFCRDHSTVLSYDKETKLISIIKSASVHDSPNMSDPNAVSEIALCESIQTVLQTKSEQVEIDDHSTAGLTHEDNFSAETSGLRFLIALINEYGPLSIKAVNDHWSMASPIVRQSFGEASKSGYLSGKQLKEFCEKHCDVFNYSKKTVSIVDSFSSYVKVFRTDPNQDVGSVTNGGAISSVATNSSNENETLTLNPKMHHENQRLQANKNSITRDANLIENKSLDCVKGIIQRYGPIFVNTLKQLLLGTKWGRKAAPSDVLTYLSRTPDVDSLTNTKLTDFIMNHSDQFDIQDSKVYLVNSKQYAAWIANEAHEELLTRASSSSVSSIFSSNTGICLQIHGEVKTKSIEATPQNHNVKFDRAAISDNQYPRSESMFVSVENNPVEMSALTFLTSLVESVGPVSFSALNDSRNIASAEIRQLFGETPQNSTLKEKRLKRFCERHGNVLKYERNTVSLVGPLLYEGKCVTDTLVTSECDLHSVLDRQNDDNENLMPQTNVHPEHEKRHPNDNSCTKDTSLIEQISRNCIVNIIKRFGPLYVNRLKQLLLGTKWNQEPAPLDVLTYLGRRANSESIPTTKMINLIMRNGDLFDIKDSQVFLVNSRQYADQVARELSQKSLPVDERTSVDSTSYDDIRNIEADLVEDSALNFLVELVRSQGRLSFSSLNSYRRLATVEVRQLFGATSESPGFKRIELMEFCDRHNDILNYNESEIYLIDRISDTPIVQDGVSQKCTRAVDVVNTNATTKSLVGLNSVFDIQNENPIREDDRNRFHQNIVLEIPAVTTELFQTVPQTKSGQKVIVDHFITNTYPVHDSSVEMSGLKFLVSLINHYGPLSLADLNIHWPLASLKVWQCFGEVSEMSTLKRRQLKEFCERHGDILNYTKKAVSLVDSNSAYVNAVLNDSVHSSESITNTGPLSHVAEGAKSDFEILTPKIKVQHGDQKRHQYDSNSTEETNPVEQNYLNKSFQFELLQNSGEVDHAVVSDEDYQIKGDAPCSVENTLLEISVLKFLVPLIRAVGPLSFMAIDDVLDVASSGIRQYFRENPETCSLKGENLKRFCEKYCAVLKCENLTVSLFDYSAYKNIIKTNAQELTAPNSRSVNKARSVTNSVSISKIDSASASEVSTAKPKVHDDNQTKQLKDNSCTAYSSIELKSLHCVSDIVKKSGPIFVSTLKQLLLGKTRAKKKTPSDVLIYLSQTSDVNLLTATKVKNFILEHGDQFDIQEGQVYLVNSKEYAALMDEEPRQDSSSVLRRSTSSSLEDTSTVDTEIDIKALMCIKKIILKYGPTYFKSLKPLLLGRKYGQKASPLDVLIHLSGSDDVESLTPAALKEFILKHSDHIAKHDGKVYLVNSSQKASKIIQKLHEESILQDILLTIDATSDCNSETLPEEVAEIATLSEEVKEIATLSEEVKEIATLPEEVNSVQSMPFDNTHEDSGIVLFSNITEAYSGNNYTSDVAVESVALEFLVCLMQSYGPLTFSTLSDLRHLASPEVQQFFGATRGHPFLNRNKLREFCQRHCDVLYATNKLEITFAETNTNESILPLEQIGNSGQSSKERKTYSPGAQTGPKRKSKKMTVTTYDSLRMSPVIDESYEYRFASNNLNSSLCSSSFESSFNLVDSTSVEFDESLVEDVSPASDAYQQFKSADDAASGDGDVFK